MLGFVLRQTLGIMTLYLSLGSERPVAFVCLFTACTLLLLLEEQSTDRQRDLAEQTNMAGVQLQSACRVQHRGTQVRTTVQHEVQARGRQADREPCCRTRARPICHHHM
ncbi:hypothetical protein ABBQ32_002000 [Trebouxia sp. C0010 RCD-2024]